MNIKVTEQYEFAGTRIQLDRSKIYEGTPATDLKDYEVFQWVRIRGVNEPHGLCLKKGEYEIVKDKHIPTLRDALM